MKSMMICASFVLALVNPADAARPCVIGRAPVRNIKEAQVPEHYLPKLPPAKKGRWTLACRTESVAPPGLRGMSPRTFLICAALATAGSAMTSGCAVETTLPSHLTV